MGSILFGGTFAALLNLALYGNIGDLSKIYDNDDLTRWIFNVNGLCFLISNNISFTSSSSVV
jgi:hypothetical protein